MISYCTNVGCFMYAPCEVHDDFQIPFIPNKEFFTMTANNRCKVMVVAMSALLLQLGKMRQRFRPFVSNSEFLFDVLQVPCFVVRNHHIVGKDLAAWIIFQTLQISPDNKRCPTPQGLANFIASISDNFPCAIEFCTDYNKYLK